MKKLQILSLLTLCICLILSACTPSWQINIFTNEKNIGVIQKEDVSHFIAKSMEEIDRISLGQIFYAKGFILIEGIQLMEKGEQIASFVWDSIAESASISESGKVSIAEKTYQPDHILISPADLSAEIDISIMDIPLVIANFLSIPNLLNKGRDPILTGEANYGVMILLDGLQFRKLENMIYAGKLPFFATITNIKQGLTVYPPITTSATAALLTSSPPEVNGVYGYGYRATETTTLFDLAVDLNKRVVAVEGASLPFNLRNAETMLSGDRDGNGYSDDNVCTNSLDVINTNMPDLLYIHFHEIDDMGHSFGPDSQEYENAIVRVDDYLAQIYQALPDNTIIAIFADHGMHAVGNGGNHGTLIADDLIIPIIFLEK